MYKSIFKKTDKEEHFWNWFVKNSNLYFHFEQNQNALFQKLKVELDKIDSNLVFEFSSILENGKREFVISADGIKSSFASVISLTQKAPVIQNWEVVAFRQPRKEVTQINYEGLSVDLEDIFFKFRKNKGKIDLELHIKDFFESGEWTAIAFILLDNILGEYHTEMSLDFIDKKKLDVNERHELYPIEMLSKIVQDYHSEFNN